MALMNVAVFCRHQYDYGKALFVDGGDRMVVMLMMSECLSLHE